MLFYHRLGKIPHKRHTIFRKPDGALHYEQLFGTEGFSGVSSLLYHLHRPTQVKEIRNSYDDSPSVAVEKNLKAFSFAGFEIQPESDFLKSRTPVLVNNDLQIQLAAPTTSQKDYFYKNADADEMIFVHRGSGKLRTILGNIDFGYGDYLVIPRGMIYRIEFDDDDNRLLLVNSFSPIRAPGRYRNEVGQLLEHAPYCERDIRVPQELDTHDEKGDFLIRIRKEGVVHEYIYATHPFDVVGWDGYNYPFAFSIHDFEPITGRVHQPPPVHQTFEAHNFVVCSFCPRLFDYHPESIPAPYNHSNIDSDEVLYYVDGDFMSRKGVDKGQITLHPAGIPHGPHPGATENSIGKESTDELAVMIDTFKPLQLTDQAMNIEDGAYYRSWLNDEDQ
ncbi:MAG: homogentisate 1,2-dioxygenase [Flavobacteriales bacterium]